ncbi:c-type cytochrome biogenesis protein CcmI [Pseudorhodobacter ferrugineus]|uniref:c-type cytochrome biogenesis protein CcmI n=1 Tax=Pseudorhodobacter ferrugineus TaxID=77008 RepID=UPI0003B636F5|nr:c-type cytochrome biogenesis protein CcmI [Pseudorhodobacter ferrugineus]
MDIIFWTAAGIITLAVAVILLRAIRQNVDSTLAPEAFDQRVYRDQLAEIERDQARGIIAEDEIKRLRSEVARRLLATDRVEAVAEVSKSGPRSVWVLGTVALVLAAGFGGYAWLGQPGYGDLPLKARIIIAEERRAERRDQAVLEAALPARPALEAVDPAFVELVEKLRAAVANRPDDLQGQMLLARNEANLGNLTAAYRAQERVLAIKGAEATDADLLTQATLMVQAADGQVSPEAEALFQSVLARSPDNDTALFFTGIVNMQVGRYDLAFAYWKRLQDTAPADSPWRAEVAARMVALAEVAGVKYQPPAASMAPALPGPDADAVAAAQDMSPEERQAMIRGMVEGLNDRLATEGGSAEEWARLITALANLGEKDRAAAIYAEAQKTFAGRTVELSGLRQAAVEAGVGQ